MINIAAIKDMITTHGMTPIEVSHYQIDNKVYIAVDTPMDFIDLVSSWNEKYIYLSTRNYLLEDFLIPDDWYDEYPKDFVKEVRVYNKKIKSLDMDRPKQTMLFVLQNGVMIIHEIIDPWIEDLGFKFAEDQIEELEAAYYSEIKKIKHKVKNQDQELKQQLREYIMSDPEFAHKKNQESRYWYFHEVMEREEMSKYRDLLMPYGAPHTGKVKMFMDEAWRLLKQRKEEIK